MNKLKFTKNIAIFALATFSVAISTSCNKPVIVEKMMFGNVITLDKDNSRYEAIGIKDGKIAFVGSKNEANAHLNDSTEIIDYKDNYIYPGFVDAHSHPAMLGAVLAGGCLVTPDMTSTETLSKFKEYIIAHPGQKIYKCYGSYAANKNGIKQYHYTYKMIEEALKDLDEETLPKDAIVIVVDYGGHSGCLNSAGIKALKERFKLTEDKVKELKMMDTIELEDVDGDGKEEINGNVSETPAYTFYYDIPCNLEEVKQGILLQQEQVLAKMGYTTIGDCGVQQGNIPTITALSELGAEGKLKFKVRAYYLIMENDSISAKDQVKTALELAKKYNNEYFKIIGLKVFMDGVSEKETCYTTEPYINNPSSEYKTYNGVFRWGKEWRPIMSIAPDLKDIIAEANRNGLSVTAHAFGDAAVRFMLDKYEEARREVQYERNSISHCAYVRDDDINRFKELHVAPLVAPHWAMRTAGADNHEKRIFGEYDPNNPNGRSLQKMYKIKSFINEENSHVSFHTDGMCPDGVPYMLYTAINRVDPDNADPTKSGYIGPRDINECVTPMEALKCMSANPAFLLGEEENIGSIEINKSADFSIYPVNFTSVNTFKQENYDVSRTPVIATYINGNLAYTANRILKNT